ncbi:unnamed protein product [Rotaria magnacalcarata]|uniref:Uncharacterized protein n=1 Tax=Rotaria magnacalcarata TaxID=392030 RepID=A0A816R3Q2_9BILA|nr:unnamed protein product [Rotaria magnacalcarata]
MFMWFILLFIISYANSIEFNPNEIKATDKNAIFVIYPSLYLCNNGSFSFEFRTKTKNGLIFYTYDNYNLDSILVSIYQGKLIVEQNFSKNKSYQKFDQSINDNKWYKIVFKRRSSLITEIVLYSVALRNVENRIIKTKVLNYSPFTSLNTSSSVYIGGLPFNIYKKERFSSEFLFQSYHGYVRNLRYGICGCPERIQHPIYSSLFNNYQSEVCEQQTSLCSSSSCECLNVDEEPRYQCDCSNKTCSILTMMNNNLIKYEIDFTSVEYKSKSAELSFTFGANPNNYNVVRKNIQTNFNENNLITFSPIHNQQENCMWDLSRCSTELTFTFIFSIDRMNSSSSIFSQYFKNDASLHINFIVLNSSSPSLHFDLWLPFNHGLLRTQITEFSYQTPLLVNLIYRSPSSLSVFLFGQLVDYTIKSIFIQPNKPSSSSSLSFNTYVQFRSITWSYQKQPFGGALTEASLGSNRLIPKTISEYPSPANVRTKYTTDEEDYTLSESISFSLLTNQQISQATTILSGFAYDNIYYVFDIEDGKPKIIFSQDDLPEVILTSKSTNQMMINDGKWHRLNVQRLDRKLRFDLDNVEQSDVQLPDGWQTKTNIFIGAELTPVPNGNFNGKIGDIMVGNTGQAINLREEDLTDENDENVKDSTTPTISSQSLSNDKVFVVVDMKSSDSSQTIGFLPNDNNEIVIPSPTNAQFNKLVFSFRTRSNVSTLMQFDQISLNTDVDGYLALVIRDKLAQRILLNDEQKPINDGNLYTVHLQRSDKNLEAWIMKSKSFKPNKISVELSTSKLIIENFIFGPRSQFTGCLQNITFNDQLLSFKQLSLNRQQCPSSSIVLKTAEILSYNDIYIDQIISFKEYDRPLIITFDNPEEFRIFSFSFFTQDTNSIICSLADRTYEHFLTLSIYNERLLLTYDDKQRKRMKIFMNNSILINDGREHKLILKLINKDDLIFDIDGTVTMKKFSNNFRINKIYIGQLDGFIKEKIPDLDGDNFIGCIKDIMLNEKSTLKLDHIHHLARLTNICQLIKRGRKNVVSYVAPEVSFSMRDRRDVIELQVQPNDEFRYCQMPIKTLSPNGVITSMYSNDDQRGLVLCLKDGKLQLKYYSPINKTSHILYNDNQTINDGRQHRILVTRQIPGADSQEKMHVQIDKRATQVQIPEQSPMFFDVVTIGGSYRLMPETSSQPFVGCYANVTYNRHPLLPDGALKADRYDCFYQQGTMCDRQIPCQQQNNRPLSFCGQTDCSMVCAPPSVDMGNTGLVRYFSQIGPGQNEQIEITIFTTSSNSTLYVARDGPTQVSIVLQNYYPRLIIQNGPSIYTYDFPSRVRGDQWHTLHCQKTSNTLDLTFDYETRRYTNLTGYFSLFGDRKINICGTNFYGYVQDVILVADNRRENLIQSCIRNPSLVDYDPSIVWNNRAAIPEPAPPPPPPPPAAAAAAAAASQYEGRPVGAVPCYLGCWSPCERINCLNGGYCIQPATATTLAYCNCPAQYTGYRCEQTISTDPCLNYQCNHGTCQKDRNNQPYCSCYEGYGGSRCETQIDPCARVNCNHGRCEIDRTVAVCRCYQGYTGHDCLTPLDACARVSCNYGSCVNEGASYRCDCQRGYEGSACDQQIDPCLNFVCYNGGLCLVQNTNQPMCQCAQGYRGPNCYESDDVCDNVNCNYGQCSVNQHDGTAYCICLPGYAGAMCLDEVRVDLIIDPCLRYDCAGGTCTNDRGVARCICPIGRVGSHCQDDICTMYPCANNGQCIPEGNSRRCICPAPYYGDDCREFHRPNPCDNVHCNYGYCRDGNCECHTGYSGPRCDLPTDPCAGINCYHGTCLEGRCTCLEGYTGYYCDTPPTTQPPILIIGVSSHRPPLTAQTVAIIGPKKGQLIDYGRLLGGRAGPIGWVLAIVSAFLLFPLALAFATRKCALGACLPGGARAGYVPVLTGATGVTQTENALYAGPDSRAARDLQLVDQRADNLASSAAAGSSGGMETTRIEQTREIVREYGGMDTAGGVFPNYPTMSSRYGDFARDAHHQQSSSAYSQQHVIETDYHAPPVGDFGYGRGGIAAEGYRDTFDSWEGAAGGYSMNAMFAEGGLQTDYELSNINSVSMTPNGKYAIVGQSQGPPQIWDAVNGQLVSSMQGTSSHCGKVALACSGTLLVGLASDGIDAQPCVLQIWDVNTGKPVQLTHQIKCATFALSNNSNNLIMAGNQKYGRGISVGILDLNNSELTKEIKSDTNQSYGGTPSFITLTPDERFAIVGCPSGLASTNYVVFDLTTQQELVQPPTIALDSDAKCSIVLNNDQMVTGTKSGQLVLWDIPTCQRLHTLNDNGQNAHRDRITDLKLSPDRSCLVSTSADGTGKVWDANSKELISKLIGHKREITCSCVSTNQLVATGSKDQNVCLWRLQTGQLASTMPIGMTPIDIHMAAHNRTIVAIGDRDGERQLLMLRVVSVQR